MTSFRKSFVSCTILTISLLLIACGGGGSSSGSGGAAFNGTYRGSETLIAALNGGPAVSLGTEPIVMTIDNGRVIIRDSTNVGYVGNIGTNGTFKASNNFSNPIFIPGVGDCTGTQIYTGQVNGARALGTFAARYDCTIGRLVINGKFTTVRGNSSTSRALSSSPSSGSNSGSNSPMKRIPMRVSHGA